MKKLLMLICFILGLQCIIFSAYTADFYELTRSTCGNTTLADIRTMVREEINDSTNTYNTNRYSDVELNKYINIIHEDISIITKCLHAEATGQLTGGTTAYYLTTNSLGIERLEFDSDTILSEKNPFNMDKDDADWFTAETSSPTAYYRFPGYEKIGFQPCPEYTGGSIHIWYTKVADSLDSDTDEIFDSIPLLNSFRRTIVVGVAYIIFIQENDTAYQLKLQEYQSYLDLIKKNYDFNPNFNPNLRIYKK